MTPAELKTIREAVGLAVPDLAALADVQERTVRYWESGRNVVPDDVAQMALDLDARLDDLVAELVAFVKDAISLRGGAPEDIALLRYRENADLWHFRPDFRPLPTTTHAALLARSRAALADLHVKTRIVYMDPQAYARWLDGRADSELARSVWAGLQQL
jgi:transcriptional regulator with XRE-family HTH domain